MDASLHVVSPMPTSTRVLFFFSPWHLSHYLSFTLLVSVVPSGILPEARPNRLFVLVRVPLPPFFRHVTEFSTLSPPRHPPPGLVFVLQGCYSRALPLASSSHLFFVQLRRSPAPMVTSSLFLYLSFAIVGLGIRFCSLHDPGRCLFFIIFAGGRV